MEEKKEEVLEETKEELEEDLNNDNDLNLKIEKLEKTILVKLNEIEEKITSLITSNEEVEEVEEDEDLFDY